MASDRRLEDSISTWLEETAPERLPARVLDATFERTRRSKQGGRWRTLLGRSQMPRFVPALGGAAVVVMATVGALSLALRSGVGGPSQSPLATAVPSAAATPTADEWGCVNPADAGGTYRGSVGTMSVTATVPEGWRGSIEGFSLRNFHCFFSASMGLQIDAIDVVASDACHWRSTAVDVTTPAAAAAALAAQEGHETTGPTDTTVGGYPAKRFELAAAPGLDIETCDNNVVLVAGRFGNAAFEGPDPDGHVTFYVVDVGGQAVGVKASRAQDLSPADVAELDAVVASLRFER